MNFKTKGKAIWEGRFIEGQNGEAGLEQKRSNPRSCKWQGTREQCCIGTIASKNELILSHLDQDSVPWGKRPNSAWAPTRAILEP